MPCSLSKKAGVLSAVDRVKGVKSSKAQGRTSSARPEVDDGGGDGDGLSMRCWLVEAVVY